MLSNKIIRHLSRHMIKIKNLLLLFLLIAGSLPNDSQAQNVQKKFYGTTGGELIFSFADVEYDDLNINTNMRFTLFFHAGHYVHYDFAERLGAFSGLGIRNVGYITKTDDIKTKRRSYMLGMPLALKIGNLAENNYMFFGAEYEWLFNYKQKKFEDGTKSKYNEWFSDRTNTFLPSVFVGIQFPIGLNVKVKYYLENFMNQNYRGEEFWDPVSYEHWDTQIIYLSLSFNLKKFSLDDIFQERNNSVNTNFATR